MLIELHGLPINLAPDGAILLGEVYIVLLLDDLPDTQDGEFDFHIIECHWERLVLHLAFDQTSAFVEPFVSAGSGGEVVSFRSWGGSDLVDILWNMFPNPCRVDRGPTVDKAEDLIGAALEFHRLGSQ